MKANYATMSRTKARQIAKEEVSRMYEHVFAECAADVMAQVMANVLLTLERDYGWRKERLATFIHNVQSWVDIMQKPSEITDTWSTNDNIDYFKKKYGIDLREEFKPEITGR